MKAPSSPTGAVIFTAVIAIGLFVPALSQSRPSAGKNNVANQHKLIAVKATGSARYGDREILAASGLALGQNATEGDFKEAAQRLGNSGLFTEVQFSFSYSDAGTKVDFQLTDSDKIKLVPPRFENFVWFTEPELLATIQRQVPLFRDRVPLAGQMPEQIAKALQALLSERHLPGSVDYLREGTQEGGDLKAIVYRVTEVVVRIHSVEFPGATAEQAAFLAYGARKLADAEYSRSAIAAVARFDLLPLLLERGYLKAEFGAAEARVLPSSSESTPHSPQDQNSQNQVEQETVVDALIPTTPGKQYSVSEVVWKGNSAVTTEETSALIHLPAAQPADAVRLGRDLDALAKLYRSRGYMAVKVTPDAQIDDDKNAVRYVINIAEGDLYRMGELEFLGVDSASRDRLHAAWKLREGQPYDAGYLRNFLDDAPRLLPKGLRYSTKISEDLDPKDKTVDVTIHFKTE